MKRLRRQLARIAVVLSAATVATCLPAPRLQAVTITLDYSYDTLNYFGDDHPQGAAAGALAKASLEAAASYLSNILHDTLSPIVKPPDFHSSQFSGQASWNWTAVFTHPTTGQANFSVMNSTIAQDEYRIYAGSRDLSGSTLGQGGAGGFSWNYLPQGGFSQAEINQLNAITADFESAVEMRHETDGFARWGGAITFDRTGPIWHFDHTTPIQAGENDFYSVAIHELSHALGLGGSADWNGLVAGGAFTGIAATAANGGVAPPLAAGANHWATGLTSEIYGTTTSQIASMTPSITEGTRKLLTKLDAAALADIGWEVAVPAPSYNPADFDFDTLVNDDDLQLWKLTLGASAAADADGDNDSDGNDFLIWQRSVGNPSIAPVPEPGAIALAAGGAMAVIVASGRRRRRHAASSGRI